MVIDCLSESAKIEEQIYWYKAELHEDFRICYDEFWQNNAFYLKERLEHIDPTNKNSAEAREDDYYKYVGGNAKNKIRFNLKMGEERDPDEDD